MNIPTAEEFLNKKSDSFDTQMRRSTFYESSVKSLCIEFAKLHVQAALKAADKEARRFVDDYEEEEYKLQIINCYSLTNIK